MVPEGWSNTSLGDLVNYKKGFAFDSSDYSEDGVRVIRISDTTRDGLHSNNPKYVAEGRADGFSDWQLFGGDIIVSTVGSRPHLLDSMVGKAVRIPSNFNGSLLNQNLVKLAPRKDRVISEVLYPHLKDNRFITFISGLVRGNANQVSITLKELFAFPILLPPLPEQRKIADILSTWDRAIEKTESLLANARAQKRALMQSLLTGKRRFPAFDGQPWKEVRLGDVVQCLDNKRVPLNSGQRNEMQGDIPYWGANGIVGYVNDYIFDEPLVLLAEDGGYFDEFATRPIASLSYGKAWVNNHAHILRAGEQVQTEWLYYALVNRNILGFINSGTRSKLNKGDMLKIPLELPSVPEQSRIADAIGLADRDVNDLEQQITKLRTEKKALMQQLLTGKRRVVLDA